jgi:rhodanese-related sulfurtransferase
MDEVATISRQELEQKLARKDVVLVETLAEEKYQAAHLPGAINVPSARVGELAAGMLPDKNAQIVVYCSSSH